MNGPAIMAAMVARFGDAAAAVGERRVTLEIAGRLVVLRFAGGFADAVLPAFMHLARAHDDARDDADLTIHFWDTASTGVGMIPPPWSLEAGPSNLLAGAEADGLRATYRGDNGLFTVLDAAAGQAIVWMRDGAKLDRHDRAAPLRSLFGAYFAKLGLAMTHGAAIGRGGRGVLLGGQGGSGKSTTSLLCLEAGFDYAGDDYVLVDPEVAEVHGVYATGKVLPASRVRMPHIGRTLGGAFEAAARGVEPGDKAIAYLYEHVPAQLSRGFALAGVVLPFVSGEVDTQVAPLSSAAALRLLAPSTVFQNGDEARATLAALAKLVARVPCHRLALGTDLAQIPRAIERLTGLGG